MLKGSPIFPINLGASILRKKIEKSPPPVSKNHCWKMLNAVVYAIVASALIFLFHSQPVADRHISTTSPLGTLSRRLGYKITPTNFDPLLDKLSSKKNLNENEEAFLSEGRLNVTLRLMVLFPFLDIAPKDGFVDSKELEAWMVQPTMDRLDLRAHRELKYYDKNEDGVISFSEYLPQFSIADIESNNMEHGQAGWWKEQFDNADANHDGNLDFFEFNDFLHPEDSNNDHIHNWLLRRKIRQVDHDKDEKVNYLEFLNGIYDTYESYIEFESMGAIITSPANVFGKLDINKDSYLKVEELKPLLRYLCPGELAFSKFYSTYVIREADENGDKKLTLNEMLNHDDLFYSNFYDDDEEDLHDEL